MAGVKGQNSPCCAGLTDAQVAQLITKKYKDFCLYRSELASNMPDYKRGLFSERVFSGRFFEIGGGPHE